jgi:hypothetical protein
MNSLIKPNIAEPSNAALDNSAGTSLGDIAAKMAAMREQTLRNQIRTTDDAATGNTEAQAGAVSPVAPPVPEDSEQPQIQEGEASEDLTALDDNTALAESESDPVSQDTADTTGQELIDFVEFAQQNPDAKFRFTRNGKEVIIDARKAAAILGQGGAIHEEARQLKIERAEFDEYIKTKRAEQEGLTLAMEFTVQPQLQRAYDEIVKTQGYQTVFRQQMAATQDVAQQARIQASMQQNEQYIRQQQALIGQLKPQVDQFRQVRRQQVQEVLENNRRQFADKELKNEFVYNELRGKIEKLWPDARTELIPGVANIDLIASDETLLGLVRDGLKYRNAARPRSAGNSIAQLTARKGSSTERSNTDELGKLREAAKSGDKKAGDNLLVQRLREIRSSRGGR